MPKVFISYRRDDSQHQADRIFDALRRVVPKKNLFIDIDGIPAGVDFVDHLNKQVEQCDVLLALIGPDWIDTTSADGQRRLEDPRDFVRVEIAAALKRRIKVAPVLLDGATMPLERDLPPDIAELARRNAIEVRRNSFDADAERMIQKLGLRETRRKAAVIAAWAGVLAVVGGIATWAVTTVLGEAERVKMAAEQMRIAEAELALARTEAPPAQAEPLPAAVPENAPETAPPVVEPAKTAETPAPAPKVEKPACTDCPPLSRVKLPAGKTIEVSAPITLGDWRLYCASAACGEWDRKRDADFPMTSVSWMAANQYVAWLSARMGRQLRLPTTDEVEALTAQPPAEVGSGFSEWTSTCHGGAPAACQDYEVRGWDSRGRQVADWHSSNAKGSTIGFRVVAAGKL